MLSAARAYEVFDFTIERSADHCWARVLNSPAGQARQPLELFGEGWFERDGLQRWIEEIGAAADGLERVGDDSAQHMGRRLFEYAFRGSIGDCFQRSLDLAGQKGAGLRICLRFSETSRLAGLPWELLYDHRRDRYFSLSADTPICRYLEFPDPVRSPVTSPIRVLVVASRPNDRQSLDTENEWRQLARSLRKLQQGGALVLERLLPASLEKLESRLQQGSFHVLHFIGHGRFDEGADGGCLVLSDSYDRGIEIGGQRLAALLNHRSLRLVVLNCCDGGRPSHSSLFNGLAQSLIRQGIPAVVAMQHQISDHAAVEFSGRFYSALADGHPIDAAAALARRQLCLASSDEDSPFWIVRRSKGRPADWLAPIVYTRDQSCRLMKLEDEGENEEQKPRHSVPWRSVALFLIALAAWFGLRFQPTAPQTTTALLITDESDPEVRGVAFPIPLAGIAMLMEAVAAKNPRSLAVLIDLTEPLYPDRDEARELSALLRDSSFPTVVLEGARRELVQAAGGVAASKEVLKGSNLLGAPVSGVLVHSDSGARPLFAVLAQSRIPRWAESAILPLNAYWHMRQVDEPPAAMVLEHGRRLIEGRIVVLGGALQSNRPAEMVDVHRIIAPPWSEYWDAELPGATIQALLAGYAARGGLLWGISQKYALAVLAVGLLLTLAGRGSAGAAVSLAYLGCALILRLLGGAVVPMWPVWALSVVDGFVVRRWLWQRNG